MARKSDPSRLLHEPARFKIISFLAATEEKEVSFNLIKASLHMTAGNLSIQLKKLEEGNLIKIVKEFRNNKPLTTIFITKKGLGLLTAYLEQMSQILLELKRKEAS